MSPKKPKTPRLKLQKRRRLLSLFLLVVLLALVGRLFWQKYNSPASVERIAPYWLSKQSAKNFVKWVVLNPYEIDQIPMANSWQMPMGSRHGAWIYNARNFREENHLGDDLNGIGGWDSDLRDPVWAVAAGLVVFAGDVGGGWGNIVILAHKEKVMGKIKIIQTMYAHLDEIKVDLWRKVVRGETIGTVGTAGGQYLAHLHLEWREGLVVAPDRGYSLQELNRKSPTEEIRKRLAKFPE